MCLAKSETNLLATAGYDSLIIVWNMVSGHIFSKLSSPKPDYHENSNCIKNLKFFQVLLF